MRAAARLLIATAAATACVIAGLPAASAMTGGNADGGEHPNVAMLLFYGEEGDGPAFRYRCTGSLVSETVILTAGHCTEGTVGKTLVFFQDVIAEEAPSLLPRAAGDELDADGNSPGSTTGFLGNEKDGAGRTYVAGTAYTHPGYSNFTDVDNWNDVGVIVLDAPVSGIEAMQVAPENYLDAFAQPALNKTLFTFVGYGTEVRKPDEGPQKPTPQSYPLIRRNTTAQGQKLTPQLLQVNGNPNNVIGGGGTCFGDSGGPGMLNDYQVTVTSYGYTDNCRYIDGHQRVDIPVVQDWLLPIIKSGVAPGEEPVVVDDTTNGNGKGKALGLTKGNADNSNGANAKGGQANGNGPVSVQGGPGQAVGHDNDTGRDAEHAARG